MAFCATPESGIVQRASAYKVVMPICKIHHVKHKDSFRWKWRHVAPDGGVRESERSYALYYECVTAARASGYEVLLRLKVPA